MQRTHRTREQGPWRASCFSAPSEGTQPECWLGERASLRVLPLIALEPPLIPSRRGLSHPHRALPQFQTLQQTNMWLVSEATKNWGGLLTAIGNWNAVGVFALSSPPPPSNLLFLIWFKKQRNRHVEILHREKKKVKIN